MLVAKGQKKKRGGRRGRQVNEMGHAGGEENHEI